jgi:hypothetical protein
VLELVFAAACMVTYNVDASASVDYIRTIPRAQRIVTEATGIQFVSVSNSADADVTYVQHKGFVLPAKVPTIPVHGMSAVGAWVSNTKTVHLSTQFRPARLPIVLHETLHAVGVHHVDDPKAVMSSTLTFTTTFTDADREALARVSCED